MNPTPELIALLRTVGEAGFQLRPRGDRIAIVGRNEPSPDLVTRVRAAKPALLELAPRLTWRCQTIVWPAATWLQYDVRVREIAGTGIGRLEAECMAYPEFAPYNVVTTIDQAIPAGMAGRDREPNE